MKHIHKKERKNDVRYTWERDWFKRESHTHTSNTSFIIVILAITQNTQQKKTQEHKMFLEREREKRFFFFFVVVINNNNVIIELTLSRGIDDYDDDGEVDHYWYNHELDNKVFFLWYKLTTTTTTISRQGINPQFV